MKALILAAGYATRLYPLTKDHPKPLLMLGKRPILNYILEKLKDLDSLTEIIVVTNSKFFSHFKKWSKGLKIEKRFSLVDDLTRSLSDRLGAIGDLRFVIDKKRIKEDLLVIAGDNIFDTGLEEFISFAQDKKSPVIGAYKLRSKVRAKKYGIIQLDSKNRLIDFKEKPKVPKSTLAAMCLYYFPKSKLGLLKEYMGHADHKHDTAGSYITWLKDKVSVYVFVFGGSWFDIGDHKSYSEAQKQFTKGWIKYVGA